VFDGEVSWDPNIDGITDEQQRADEELGPHFFEEESEELDQEDQLVLVGDMTDDVNDVNITNGPDDAPNVDNQDLI